MKRMWKQLLAIVMCLALIVPTGVMAEGEAVRYGVVTDNQVNVRKTAGADGALWFKADEGHVGQILDEQTVDGKLWYKVSTGHPTPNGRTYIGWIVETFFREMTAAEVQEYLDGQEISGSGETSEPELPGQGDGQVTINSTGEVTADKVNFRMQPNITASIYGKVNTGTVVQLLSIPTKIDAEHWYKVLYNGRVGYIQSPFIRVLSVDEDSLPDPEVFGYAQLDVDSVSLRATAGGDSVVQWKGKGSLLRITGEPVFSSGYNWYPVFYPSTYAIYYVREDMIRIMLLEGGELVTPAPTESPYGYIVTTKSGVNLRTGVEGGVAGPSQAQVPKNTILACVGPSLSPAETGTSYTWYKVRYHGIIGYLRGDCVRVCNSTGGSIVEPEPDDPAEPTPPAGDILTGYIRLTKDGVNLRATQAGNPKTQLPLGLILPYYGDITPAGKFGKYCWYYVKTADGMDGYIRGDCAIICDEGGVEVTPKPDGTEVTGAKGRLLKNTNFRKAAGFDGAFITLIPADTIVDVLIVPNDTVNGWYKIRYNGQEGYVLASLLQQLEPGTVAPSPTPSAFGYVMINDEKVAFRNAPGGNTVYTRLENGTVWPMTGVAVEDKNGVRWYPINVNGKPGYVHGGFSFKLSPTQEESYLAGNGVPEEAPDTDSILTAYIITTYDDVNLRESYSLEATKAYQVDKGTVMAFNDTKLQGTVTWYSIVYDHQPLWVHGNYVKIMTQKEYQDFIAENPGFVPDPNANLGYVKLTMDNVYIRNAAAGSIIDQLRQGTILPYYVDGIQGGGFVWFRVKTPDGSFGYIRADMVTKCEANGDPLPVPTPNPDDTSSAPKLQQMTTYVNLYQGMTNSEANQARVRNLVQELINQGYYTGSVTSSYTSEVKEAVKNFQTLNDLSATGTADSATQHALFGTRPNGAGDTTNLEFVAYPVEKIDWFTGGIQEMLPRGAKFKVYDVKTKIVWWAYRQAGGKHMDIETLTAEDSKRLCEIYGVKNLQQIVDENKWQRRPSLVTIGTRTFACSLDGMQHGDDTIANNGMDGQICLHFTNSTGHSPDAPVSTSHAEAIEYAYKNAPNGQKK